ncbi:MAG TPA: hypothetical protein VGB50_03310 [Flavobacterium sp.]|jgi:hypothetical protein
MIKNFLLSIFLLCSFISFSQEGSASPYSFYGLGEMRFKGTSENRAMGGISFFADSLHFNLHNPASYANLQYTTFTAGVSHLRTTLKTSTDAEKARRTNVDYLGLAFPMGRFGAGFGLVPYTSVGYKIINSGGGDDVETRYNGTGGINKVFFGTAYEITKGFNIGVDFNYFFGNIETTRLQQIDSIQLGTRVISTSAASGIGMTAGINYRKRFGKSMSFYAATTFSPAVTVSLSNEMQVGTVQFLATGGVRPVEEEDIPVADTKVKIPARFTVGAGIGKDRKWMAGGEITLNHNSSLDNRFTDIGGVVFENGIRFSGGGFFIPKFNSFSNYLARITYRAGFYYEDTGMVINNQSINDLGATFGFGFPVAGVFSNINTGFEFGKKGTTTAGLIQENYFNISLALSLNDRWFIKRRYD